MRTPRCGGPTRSIITASTVGSTESKAGESTNPPAPAQVRIPRGLRVAHDLAGVGENLQDHLQNRLIHECTLPNTTNAQPNSWLGKIRIGLQWLPF